MKLILLNFCLTLGICTGDFQTNLKQAVSLQYDIKFNMKVVNSGEVKNPAGTWIEVLRTAETCLSYKVPFKDRLGQLSLLKINRGKCDPFRSTISEIKNISSLKLSLVNDNNTKSNKLLEIITTFSDDRKSIKIPLVNYGTRKKFKKYDSQIDDYYISSINFSTEEKRETIKNGNACHAVNSSCVSVIENNCDRCEGTFYEVVDYNCPQGGSKYCGTNECGQKGKPACPRGYKVLETKLASLCFDGSPAGYCGPGLKTYCNEDKILICL
ncbi:hypothetical protein [Bacteriovorax sp. Seq25_V]|uniref:hypothetical protein n=1 Tax=Bacteriovorax sp. Seq25_V TaxID=1201288 RepID=UPI00038A24EA|nr:hypothetical protein [Bacteriovorax sp. Seq25_V]EQC47267.1 hypothetical protein M900_0519 [Bacteriovorax sp. Seq25_V]